MIRTLLLVFFVSASTLQAQEIYNSSDIKVTGAEIEATSYDRDSTANAIYIYEKGFSRFMDNGNYNLFTDYSAKIKIFNREGYKHANVAIKLFRNDKSREKIHNLVATTYYVENGIKKSATLDPQKVYTEKNENYDLIKFTFPNLVPGAVLVYSYLKESPFIFNFEPWYFQGEIPKIYSGYDTEIFGNYSYNIKKVGELPLDINTTGIKKRCYQTTPTANPADCVVSSYGMYNVPAFIEEPYLTSKFNYIARIDYELKEMAKFDGEIVKITKSWNDVDKELRQEQSIGRQLNRTSLVKDLLPNDLQQMSNDLTKAKAIYAFVKKNYKWNGEYKIYGGVDLKDLLKDKSGNISSINILLHNIYEEQGFKVLPVLSSTRANGFPTKLYPVLSEFNYLMVQLDVEGKKYLLDATEKNLDFGTVPFRSLNGYARLLDLKNGSSWIDIEPAVTSSVMLRDSIKLNADGTSTGESKHIFTGYHALRSRDALENLSEAEIFSSLSNPGKHTRADGTTLENKEDASQPLFINYQLTNESQKINEAIYVNPFAFAFFNKNPFQLKERHYPIDFGYSDAYNYSVNIEIPENHHVAELPEQKLLRLPNNGGSMQFVATQTDERNVLVHYRISFPQSSYSSGFYPYLKKFFDAIIEVQNQSIIVVKENT